MQEAYKKLVVIYCYAYIQNDKFPEHSNAQIQTCIRELFHDVPNPVEKLTRQSIQQPQTNETRMPTTVLNFPPELTEIVHSFMDYKTRKAFALTSKAAYFLHKNVTNKPENIFYVLGTDVQISRKRTWKEGSIEICHIPSIWAVRYQGSVTNLAYISEDIILHKSSSSSSYANTERNLAISYANVERESILPLVGTAMYCSNNFASYKTFNTVNYQADLVQNRNGNGKNNRCLVS